MKKLNIVLFILGYITIVMVYPFNEASAVECNVSVLRNLDKIKLEKLKTIVTKEPFPENSHYIGLKAYYHGNELKGFDRVFPGEHGLIETRYWVLSDTSYLVDYRESWYDPTADLSVIKIIQRLGGLFFVCNEKVIKVETLQSFEAFKYINAQVETIIKTYRDTYIKLTSKEK